MEQFNVAEVEKRRTFAIISHPDAGKTTITEKLLLFGGGFGVLTGFLTRLSAAGITAVMLVAMYKISWANGFFLNTFCVPGRGHGIEYNLALLGMALYLLIAGGGRWCLDRLIFRG